jgi:hypothetical protein
MIGSSPVLPYHRLLISEFSKYKLHFVFSQWNAFYEAFSTGLSFGI